MAYIKAIVFFFLAVIACSLAAEKLIREKKQVLLGAPLIRTLDDGSWFPGKYDPVAIHPAAPLALHAALPAALPWNAAYRSIVW